MNSKELQYAAAYYPNKPIIDTSLLERDKIVWNKIDDSWSDRIQGKWWARGSNAVLSDRQKELLVLRNRLLDFAGEQVCMPCDEEDFDNIMRFGQLWYGDIARLQEGYHNACHENSARVWLEADDGKVLLATGYALSADGMWRQHSWCIELSADGISLIETTTLRIAYFGFVMTDEEGKDFARSNIRK